MKSKIAQRKKVLAGATRRVAKKRGGKKAVGVALMMAKGKRLGGLKVRAPNAKTRAAMRAARRGEVVRVASVKALLADMNAGD